MTKIFLSYRRDDTSGHVGRLTDRLCARFGRDAVFRDLDSIAPGRDFAVAINQAIGECDAVVAVIGRNWTGAGGPDGQRRIDDPEDFVRVELATALERRVHLIPVLVDRAQMPSAASLPLPLAPLARRNSFEISESRWDYDVQRLIDVLDPSSPQTLSGSMPTVVAAAGPKTGTRPRIARVATPGPDSGKRRWLAAAVGGGLMLVVVVAILVMSTGGGDDPSVIAGGSTIPATTTSTSSLSSTTILAVDGPDGPAVTGGGVTPGATSPAPGSGGGGTPTPTPTAGPTTAPPTTAPPTTPAPTVPQVAPVTADAVAGNWSGTVSDGSGGSFLIAVGVRAGCGIGQTCGSVYVSNNNCTGDFILYALSGGTYEFTVANFTSTSGPSCSPGPGEYLTPQGATLHYSTNYGPVGTLNRI